MCFMRYSVSCSGRLLVSGLFRLLLFGFLFFSTVVEAHPGGHFHRGDGTMFKFWQLKSGTIVKGNFSYYDAGKVYVEQEEGVVRVIALTDLSLQDQNFVQFKVKQLLDLNSTVVIRSEVSGSNLYNYIPLFAFFLLTLILYFGFSSWLERYILSSKLGFGFFCFLFFSALIFACGKAKVSATSSTNASSILPKTNSSFIDSAFSAFKPQIATRWDDTYFYVASNGIPNHGMMIGITSWQQQVPISQPYTDANSWSIPLQPVYSNSPLSTKTNLMKGAVAIAVNGIPIFNALNNRGEDAYLIGELDQWGGHCGRGDDYHYHAAPLHLSAINGLKPIAFALDGFAVYGSKEPDGSLMSALDSCHGHVGVNKIYHYHGTTNYPYVVGAMRGRVTLDPTTSAPENQILPQAFTKPVRPATSPLRNAVITDFTSVGSNGYLLTYRLGNKNGYVRYSWDLANKYTYILTDTSGVSVTSSYQR